MILRHTFEPPDNVRLAHLCGSLDEHLRAVEQTLDVRIARRNAAFRIEAADRQAARRALALLQTLYERAGRPIAAQALQLAIAQAAAAGPAPPGADGAIVLRTRHADLQGRTPNQLRYLRSILDNDISFGIGPGQDGGQPLFRAQHENQNLL